MPNNGPFFTEKARAAAAEARRTRAALKVESKNGLEVFVVRSDNQFSWQIRQYGGVIVTAGETGFVTQSKALAAGRAALVELDDPTPSAFALQLP